MVRWLRERLYDFGQWPRNLVRDLPRRTGRLLGSAAGAGGQLPRPWQMGVLAARLFDLVGGPEAAQFLMHLVMPTSPLTEGERAALESVFGPRAMRYDEVRIAEGGLLPLIFRANGNRAFCLWHTIHLPLAGGHTRDRLDLLVHEATHVFQYERVGSVYIGEALVAQKRFGRRAYDYGGPAGLKQASAGGKPFAAFNREQQAQIAQHYFARRAAGDDLGPYSPYIAALRQGEF